MLKKFQKGNEVIQLTMNSKHELPQHIVDAAHTGAYVHLGKMNQGIYTTRYQTSNATFKTTTPIYAPEDTAQIMKWLDKSIEIYAEADIDNLKTSSSTWITKEQYIAGMRGYRKNFEILSHVLTPVGLLNYDNQVRKALMETGNLWSGDMPGDIAVLACMHMQLNRSAAFQHYQRAYSLTEAIHTGIYITPRR
jgi:hypothetical protein